jgi:hypothetical protein
MREDDLVTVAALGILAFICTDVAHEVVGHAVGLLMAGGRSGILTTTRLIYEPQLANPNWRIFDIGGPAGNLIWAAVCFLTQRSIRLIAPRLRLFLWTSMSFSIFWEFGYLIKCGVIGHGDWMALIEGLAPIWAWRATMFVIGVALYRAAISVSTSELHFILGVNTPGWRRRLVRLVITLCSAGTAIACAGAIFDPRGRIEILNSGALASLASWVGLLFVLFLFPSRPEKKSVGVGPIPRSIPLFLLAAVAAVLFIGILGPGIHFSL